MTFGSYSEELEKVKEKYIDSGFTEDSWRRLGASSLSTLRSVGFKSGADARRVAIRYRRK